MPGWATRSDTRYDMPASAWAPCIGCSGDLRPPFGRVCNCLRNDPGSVCCYLCPCAAMASKTSHCFNRQPEVFPSKGGSLILLFSGDNALLIVRLALQLFDIVAIEGNSGFSLPLCEHLNFSKSTPLLPFTIIKDMEFQRKII